MRIMMALAAAVLLSLPAFARDITMLDGKVYKNVSVENVTPLGFDMVSDNGKSLMIKHVRFTEMSEAVRKEFNYDPVKADEYLKKIQKTISTHETKNSVKLTAWKAKDEKQEPVVYDGVEKLGQKILFKAISCHPTGTVGWSCAEDETLTTGHYGKIFLKGMSLSQSSEWIGNIYPTGKTYNDGRQTMPEYVTRQP
ncbi:MAG: hypothetical protein A2X49_15655 [Lentisphaerae bacterium GWF2_52_8]|nr:MAG: hypothetical protein A2X49_15655 [Lentisphaerae bacterium GWF2_52_8]